ncbi:IclR family transcriptional regulator [Actinacidiphila sp. ITFR-21]|uniref:IclR family transcriptional regulator n=1 Tax=Actinacidiphila sp. ITFR-21 TaxID=3075199 RepID=UPI0028893604|nr:IclR family transcriptional regulator [Streptomyces sp. ITFR-21]WNI18997.1 IclR family transcriptional regulator [Streptomyces sp. ITFR-21]
MEQGHSPSVDSASRILKLLSRYRTAHASLTQICTELQLPKSSCSRILRTLESHGLLRYDSLTHLYSLGPYAIVLGARAEENTDYFADLKPVMREAAERTNMTAAWIQQVDARRMMYVAKHEGAALHRVTISIGNRFPITEVSYGQWVVAFADQAQRQCLLGGGLRAMTPATITDTELYREHLERIQEAGVLVSRGEYVPGVCAVSCPVLNPRGELLGVLAVLGLMPTMTESDYSLAIKVMVEIGARTQFHPDHRARTERTH